MTKPVIVTRLGKGSELTFQEGDDNFTNLQNATVTVAGDAGTSQAVDLNGTITVAGGTGLSTAMSTGTVTVNLDNTAVTAGTYTNADITVDAQGRVTSASNGAPGYTDSDARAALSASQNLSYNSSTGAFTGPDLSGYQTSLGFTPEDSANKNQNNGYAGLDSNGKVASAQLPSYVDDVVEAANYAALPAEGETGKIYVALDDGKVYRWSGSAYVEISPSPGSTDSVTEGSTNLYFTTARARGAISAGTNISITDGEISVSGSLGATVLDDLTDVSTDGAMNGYVLTYNSTGSNWVSQMPAAGATTLDGLDDVNTTGVSNDQVLSYNNSLMRWEPKTLSAGVPTQVAIQTTPSSSDLYFVLADSAGAGDKSLYAVNTGGLKWNSSTGQLSTGVNLNMDGGDLRVHYQGSVKLFDADDSHSVAVYAPALTSNVSFVLPNSNGTANQVLKTDGAGNTSWTTPASGGSTVFVLRVSGSDQWTGSYNRFPIATDMNPGSAITFPTSYTMIMPAGTYQVSFNGINSSAALVYLHNVTSNTDLVPLFDAYQSMGYFTVAANQTLDFKYINTGSGGKSGRIIFTKLA